MEQKLFCSWGNWKFNEKGPFQIVLLLTRVKKKTKKKKRISSFVFLLVHEKIKRKEFCALMSFIVSSRLLLDFFCHVDCWSVVVFRLHTIGSFVAKVASCPACFSFFVLKRFFFLLFAWLWFFFTSRPFAYAFQKNDQLATFATQYRTPLLKKKVRKKNWNVQNVTSY